MERPLARTVLRVWVAPEVVVERAVLVEHDNEVLHRRTRRAIVVVPPVGDHTARTEPDEN
jgi:hypothetical protein